MSRFNTGNPLGSGSPLDLDDNAKNMDEAANSSADTFQDRLGKSRLTWAGMENQFDTAQDGRQAQFAQLMISGGYEFLGDYAEGIELTSHKQVVREAGEFWRPAAGTVLPYTTTGAGMPEGGAFVNIGDGLLRQDLVQPVATFNNVADMKSAGVLDVGRKARTLGYYTPGDGGGGVYEIVAAGTGTDDGGSFIDLSGSGLQAKGLSLSERVNAIQFGAVGDGETDNAIAFSGISTFSETFGGEIYFPCGTFFSTAPLVLGKNASLRGAGKGATVFYAVDVGDAERRAVINKKGEEPQTLPRLASDVMERDVVLHFETTHGLKVGDSVLISNPTDYSFSGFRAYYRDGEFATVLEVTSPTEVVLDKPLFASHQASVVDIYSMNNPATGFLRDFSVVAPGDKDAATIYRPAIRVAYAVGFGIENVRVENAAEYACTLGISYRCKINMDASQASDAGSLSYGLVISNSQEIDVTGRYVAGRHAIQVGGSAALFSVVNRVITIHDFTAISHTRSVACDLHGNVEWCSYKDGYVEGGWGANLAGNHTVIDNCVIRTDRRGAGQSSIAIHARELTGLDQTVRNCTIYTNSGSGLYGSGIDVSSNAFTADVKSGGVLSFIDNTIYTRDTPANAIFVRNYGYSGDPWDVAIDGLTIIETGTGNSSAAAVRIRRDTADSGDAPRSIRFQNVGVFGGFSVPFDTFHIGADETKIKMDSLTGRLVLDLTSDVRFVDSPTIDFESGFPKKPSMNFTVDPYAYNAHLVGGTARFVAVPFPNGVSPRSYRVRVVRSDSSTENFPANTTVTVNWTANLSEF